jgi:hypothetical protein
MGFPMIQKALDVMTSAPFEGEGFVPIPLI